MKTPTERQYRLDERLAIMGIVVDQMTGNEIRELATELIREIVRRETPEQAYRFVESLKKVHNG